MFSSLLRLKQKKKPSEPNYQLKYFVNEHKNLAVIRSDYKFSQKSQTNFSLSAEFGKLTSGKSEVFVKSGSGSSESAIKCKVRLN